jgi:hypothetical protein
MNYEINKIVDEANVAAEAAVDAMSDRMGGDFGACGFAWVTVYPENKGNTRAGREERRVLAAMGFSKDWTGKAYQLWNPGNYRGQNIDIKEAGARAYSKVLNSYGFRASAGSRLD